ncbi:MAG: DegT/DnrJ/EryC1/StrS family aminotransferase, partial [Planctomycetota bacterium]
ARQTGFKVVEDAAHSLGSTYEHEGKTYRSGSCAHSDLATLSFHPVKNITSAEGGALLTNDDRLANLARLYVNHGMNRNIPNLPANTGGWYWEMQVLGYNYRLSDLHSALGLSQLSRLEEWKARRQAIARRYDAAFAPLKDRLKLPPWPADTSPCFHMYIVEATGPWADRRLALFEGLKEFSLLPNVHYMPIHLHPYYQAQYDFRVGDFPHAEAFYRGCISLPMYPRLTDAEVDRVIAAVTTVLTR